MNCVESLERMLRSINEDIEEAYENGLTFLPVFALMLKQKRVIETALRKMRKIQTQADEMIGGRRTEKITCEDPDRAKR